MRMAGWRDRHAVELEVQAVCDSAEKMEVHCQRAVGNGDEVLSGEK